MVYGIMKHAFAKLAYSSGVSRHLFMGGFSSVLVLAYHGIDAKGSRFPRKSFSIDAEEFERQVKYISENFNVIPIGEFDKDMPKNEEEFRNRLIITFDDGYKDNLDVAYPILAKYNLPFSIFLATSCINGSYSGKMLWHDKVYFIVWHHIGRKVDFGIFGRYGITKSNYIWIADSLCARLKIYRMEERDAIIIGWMKKFCMNIPKNLVRSMYLSWNQLKETQKRTNLMSIGAHSMNHPILANESMECIEEEISGSINKIKEEMQMPVKFFSYPNGLSHDFNEKTSKILEKNNVSASFSIVYGSNGPMANKYRLRRICVVRDDDFQSFIVKLAFAEKYSIVM